MSPFIIPGTRRVTLQVDSLPLGPRKAVECAGALGFDGIGVDGGRGAFTPERMGPSAVRDLRHLMERNGLCLSHVAADVGKPFFTLGAQDEVAERAMRITELARQLDASLVTLPLGILPPPEDELWSPAADALRFIALRAGSLDLKLAIETSPSPPERFRALLDQIASDSVALCLSPGALVVGGIDPAQAVQALGGLIDLVVVRDVLVGSDGVLTDTAWGAGVVAWPDIISALSDNGFRGFYTVRRAPAADSAAEAAKALEFVRTQGLLL